MPPTEKTTTVRSVRTAQNSRIHGKGGLQAGRVCHARHAAQLLLINAFQVRVIGSQRQKLEQVLQTNEAIISWDRRPSIELA